MKLKLISILLFTSFQIDCSAGVSPGKRKGGPGRRLAEALARLTIDTSLQSRGWETPPAPTHSEEERRRKKGDRRGFSFGDLEEGEEGCEQEHFDSIDPICLPQPVMAGQALAKGSFFDNCSFEKASSVVLCAGWSRKARKLKQEINYL